MHHHIHLSIDNRFFGTILASVGGEQACDFDFTSALAAQLLRALELALRLLVQAPNPVRLQQAE